MSPEIAHFLHSIHCHMGVRGEYEVHSDGNHVTLDHPRVWHQWTECGEDILVLERAAGEAATQQRDGLWIVDVGVGVVWW